MEDEELLLNRERLSICCGINAVFHKIEIAGELKKKRQKKQKHNCVDWHI